LTTLGALIWSQVTPGRDPWFGALPNFWWQLVSAGLLAGTALFCGWLQGVFGWTPPEIAVDPPAHAEHGHGHGHGH
jgi:hypothetical protein